MAFTLSALSDARWAFKYGPGLPNLRACGNPTQSDAKKETAHEVHAWACHVGNALFGNSDVGKGHSNHLSGYACPSRKRRTTSRNMRSVMERIIWIAGEVAVELGTDFEL